MSRLKWIRMKRQKNRRSEKKTRQKTLPTQLCHHLNHRHSLLFKSRKMAAFEKPKSSPSRESRDLSVKSLWVRSRRRWSKKKPRVSNVQLRNIYLDLATFDLYPRWRPYSFFTRHSLPVSVTPFHGGSVGKQRDRITRISGGFGVVLDGGWYQIFPTLAASVGRTRARDDALDRG